MSDEINIKIRADDNASPQIKTVERSMEGMSTTSKDAASALRKFASGGRAGAASLKLMGDSLSQVNNMAKMASAASVTAMSQMARAIDPSINKSRVLTTNVRSLVDGMHATGRSVPMQEMRSYYSGLEKSSAASAKLAASTTKLTGKSRLLTVGTRQVVDGLHDTKKSMPLTQMATYYRELERSSKSSGKLASGSKKAAAEVKKVGFWAKQSKNDFSGFTRAGEHAARGVSRAFMGVGRMIRRTVLVGAAGATVALGALARSGVQFNGQMDTYGTMMTTYLGDAKQSAALILEAQRFAMRTPLDTAAVMKSSTMLIQYGASAREAMDTTKMLADVSAGSTEKMNSLGIAFAQISAKGRLQAEEVRQLTNAGYNPLKTISKQTGESMAELTTRMKYGRIEVSEVTKALKADTGPRGKFHGNVLALSRTLPGATANIKEMTKSLSGVAMRGSYEAMTKVAVKTQDLMNVLADGVLAGDGWGVSFGRMAAKMRSAGGGVAWVGEQLENVINSKVVKFGTAFKKNVQDQMSKGATFKVAVRTSLEKSDTGSKAVGAFDAVKSKLQAFAPVVKGAMKLVGPMFKEIGDRLGKFGTALSSMSPIWTNVLAPLITGIFKGIMSIIDPLLTIFSKLAPQIGKMGTKMAPLAPIFEKVGYVIGMFFGGPILAGIGKLTKGFGLVGKAVRPLGLLISGISKFLFKVVGSVLKLGNTFIMTFARIGGTGTSVFARIMIAALKIITFPARMYAKFVMFVGKMVGNFIGGGARMAMGFLQKVHNMERGLGKMVSKFVGKMIGAIAKIGGKLKGLGSSFGSTIGSFAISVVNKGIGGLNNLIDRLRSFDTHIPKIGKPFRSLGHLPTLGDGGSFSSGSAIVGERGAEVLTLGARGATITPASHLTERRGATAGSLRSAIQSAGAGGGTTEITVVSPVSVDGREIARASAKHTVKRMARA